MSSLLLSAALAAPLLTPSSPQFRGERGDGVFPELSHPTTWGAEENVAWRVAVPGTGWSTPVVVGGKVIVTTALDPAHPSPLGLQAGMKDPASIGDGLPEPTEEVTIQVNAYALADGAPLWESVIGRAVPKHGIHPSNTYATGSPTTDGERVFVTFGDLGVVAAIDLHGEVLWRADLGAMNIDADFGTGSSLRAADGRVFAQWDNEEHSFLAALSAEDGEELWRAERPTGTSWSTPVLLPREGGTELVALGKGAVTAYEPATGAVRWSLEGIDGAFETSVGFDAKRIYLGNSGPMVRGVLLAVGRGGEGVQQLAPPEDEEPPRMVAWQVDRQGPAYASPLAHAGHLYVVGFMGIVACHDAATGERLWRERLPDAVQVVASPWAGGDEVFVLDESGRTYVLRAGPEFELLRVNEVPGLFWSTPAVAGDALILRKADGLVCVR